MPNIFPSDGPAGVGTGDPTQGLLQLQLSAAQATNSRTGLALTVEGDNNPAMLYARPDRPSGYAWHLCRNQQDAAGLTLHANGDVNCGRTLTVEQALLVSEVAGFQGGMNVSGGIRASGDVELREKVEIGGTLTTGRDATFKQNVSIGGALKIKNWELSVPDYVFEPGYRLSGLDEVAAFVQRHRHLPDMPSAAEVAADGLDAAVTLMLLLKKVEEITLHLIRHEKQLKSLRDAEEGAP
ncbi:hypothetical protein AACH06_07100 [Ideonella sp. DXS29W]|uniref:Peptidase S74 domain-containing protein n=1 Tax=Ideonella lacteola TaxID=2984193 RepID=A0ABU9BPL5_9BURK